MYNYFIIYKPYLVLSQFTSEDGKQTLKDFFTFPKDVYPVGRLDYDSEGLLILTNDKQLNNALLNPLFKHKRTYYVQVDGAITTEAITALEQGINISVDGKKYTTKPATAIELITPPIVPERIPSIRFRKYIPTPWIALSLTEGKNRQVRKMTAAVGFPTLRLIRFAIENLTIDYLKGNNIVEIDKASLFTLLNVK